MNNKKIIIATWNVGQDSAHKEITIDSYEHIKNDSFIIKAIIFYT